jgi:hypothetical protein
MPRKIKASQDETAAVLAQARGVPQGFQPVRFGPVLGKEGDEVTGTYRGPGEPIKGKGKKKIATYLIEQADGATVRILAASQIEQFLATVKEGWGVWIRRGAQIKGGKGRVTQYEFAVRKA